MRADERQEAGFYFGGVENLQYLHVNQTLEEHRNRDRVNETLEVRLRERT